MEFTTAKNKSYIIKTNNLNSIWLWLKRILFFIGINLTFFFFQIIGERDLMAVGLCAFISAFLILLIPSDDLALDDLYIYHIRKSIIPIFNKVDTYEINKIESLKFEVIIHTKFQYIEQLSYKHGNSIKIVFKDNTFARINVPLNNSNYLLLTHSITSQYKKDANEIS